MLDHVGSFKGIHFLFLLPALSLLVYLFPWRNQRRKWGSLVVSEWGTSMLPPHPDVALLKRKMCGQLTPGRVWRPVGLGRKRRFIPTPPKPPGYLLLEGSHGVGSFYPDVSQFLWLDSSATHTQLDVCQRDLHVNEWLKVGAFRLAWVEVYTDQV